MTRPEEWIASLCVVDTSKHRDGELNASLEC